MPRKSKKVDENNIEKEVKPKRRYTRRKKVKEEKPQEEEEKKEEIQAQPVLEEEKQESITIEPKRNYIKVNTPRPILENERNTRMMYLQKQLYFCKSENDKIRYNKAVEKLLLRPVIKV